MNEKSIVTVTVPADDYDLTTLDSVKAELGITNNVSDALLRRYISGASEAAAKFCNRVFAVETVSERFLSWGRFSHRGRPLQLARWPLVNLASVTEDNALLALDDDYVVDPSNGQITRRSGNEVSSWCSANVTAVYTSGFETVPADLEDAVIRMVTKRWSAKGRDATLKQREIPGVLSESFWIATGDDAGNLTPDIADILNNYRAVVVV